MYNFEVIYRWGLTMQAKTYIKATDLIAAREYALAKFGQVLSIVQVEH